MQNALRGAAATVLTPLGDPPLSGEACEIARGVWWMRLALPLGVNHINVFALDAGASWTIVDTGMATEESRQTWQQLVAGPLAAKPVGRVIATHMHRDHVGMAGWLTERFDCPLWMTNLEYEGARRTVEPGAGQLDEEALRFYRAAGWDEAALAFYRNRLASFAAGIHRLPDRFRRIVDGETLTIGPHEWRAVVGRGHSPEHLSLTCPRLGLLISGDQVLPGISTNVSLLATDPGGNPLADWLASLAKVRAMVDDDVLVLPAHNRPFRGLHARIDELIDGYESALARILVAIGQPRRAVDLFPAMFRRPVGADLVWLASGESLAHLNCLIARGLAGRERDANGIDWYLAA